MPVISDIDEHIISLRMVGTYVPGDIRAELLRVLDDPRASDAVGLLFDVSESESLKDRKPDDVQSVGYVLSSHSNQFGGRIALVGATDFAFGMMRLGSVHLGHLGVTNQVFRDAKSARAWIASEP
jgi:hypothetical protein